MNKIINLSENKINLLREIDNKNSFDVFHMLEKDQWTDCPLSFIENGPDWRYFKLHFRHSKEVYCEKCSSVELRRVDNGIFKGCYCVIEHSTSFQEEVRITIIHKNGVLKFPEIKKTLSLEQIDAMLDYENVVKMTATLMTKFDITSKWQRCETFYENLPTVFWKQMNFDRDVIHCFNLLGGVKMGKDVDEKYIRKDVCNDDVKVKFLKTVDNKRSKIKEG